MWGFGGFLLVGVGAVGWADIAPTREDVGAVWGWIEDISKGAAVVGWRLWAVAGEVEDVVGLVYALVTGVVSHGNRGTCTMACVDRAEHRAAGQHV